MGTRLGRGRRRRYGEDAGCSPFDPSPVEALSVALDTHLTFQTRMIGLTTPSHERIPRCGAGFPGSAGVPPAGGPKAHPCVQAGKMPALPGKHPCATVFPGSEGVPPAWTMAGLRRVVRYGPPARAGRMPALPGGRPRAYFHSRLNNRPQPVTGRVSIPQSRTAFHTNAATESRTGTPSSASNSVGQVGRAKVRAHDDHRLRSRRRDLPHRLRDSRLLDVGECVVDPLFEVALGDAFVAGVPCRFR